MTSANLLCGLGVWLMCFGIKALTAKVEGWFVALVMSVATTLAGVCLILSNGPWH